MKRSAPLTRTTPLARSKAPLARSRESRPRTLKRAPMSDEVRAALAARAGGRCECCGTPLPGGDFHAHHRKLRKRGGTDDLTNLVALTPAHHGWVHDHPAAATALGLMVASWDDPATTPVMRGERSLYPTDTGWTTTPPNTPEDT